MTQDWETLVLRGIAVREKGDSVNWEYGDLALEVETAYGQHKLEDFAQEVGINYHSLREYRRIAAAFEKAKRLANLSWCHHQSAAAWKGAELWLNQAVENRWTQREMVAEHSRREHIINPRVDEFVEKVTQQEVYPEHHTTEYQTVETKRQMVQEFLADPEVASDREVQDSVVEHIIKPTYDGDVMKKDNPYHHLRSDIAGASLENEKRIDMHVRLAKSEGPLAPVIQRMDEDAAMLYLSQACRKFEKLGKEVVSLLTQVGVFRESQRPELENSLAHIEEARQVIRRYMEVDSAELDEFLKDVLNREDRP
jgi:hypothetical protein